VLVVVVNKTTKWLYMRTVLWHSFFLGGAWHRLVGGYQYSGTTCQSHRQVSSSARRVLGVGGCVRDSVRCGWFSGNTREPVKLLEHIVNATTWHELPGHGREMKRQGRKKRRNERGKEASRALVG